MPGRPHSSGRRSGPPSGGPHGGGGGSKSPKTKGPPPGGPHGGSTPPPKKKTVTTGGTSPFAYTKKKTISPGITNADKKKKFAYKHLKTGPYFGSTIDYKKTLNPLKTWKDHSHFSNLLKKNLI